MKIVRPPTSLNSWKTGIAIVTIVVSIFVMLGWILNISLLLRILPEATVMKFNTAIVFFCTGIYMLVNSSQFKYAELASTVLACIIFLTGFLTGIEHIFDYSLLNFDVFWVSDPYSTSSPGRMGQSTALCATLLGFSFLISPNEDKLSIQLTLFVQKIVLTITTVAFISFILLIPLNKPSSFPFFGSMAIHSSFLFFIISSIIILTNEKSILRRLFFGVFSGSQFARRLIPVLIFIPLILGFLVIYGLERKIIDLNFAITGFTTIAIPIIFYYVAMTGIRINKIEKKNLRLRIILRERNNELTQFRAGLDRVANISKTDKNGVITYVNSRFCAITQYSEKELIGQTHELLNSGHHPNSFFNEMWNVINSGETWYGHVKNKAKHGALYWVEILAIPFSNTKGDVTEILWLANEITQRKKEEQLIKKEYIRSLEFKNKELEELTYIASHDLQEPLITLLSLTSYLAETQEDVLDDEGRKTLQFIQDTSSRMSNQIQGILQYNLQFNNLSIEEVDCNDLVSAITQDLAEKIKEKKADISFDNLPTINGYKSPLRMLFLNLMSNALKFHQKNTKPVIRIVAFELEHNWKFTVTDNGIGIEHHNLEKVFKIFQRLQKTSEYDGSGIGLAHCKKIIDLHSGNIWVESIYGVGSAFHFTVPMNLKEIKDKEFYNTT